MFPEGVKAAGA